MKEKIGILGIFGILLLVVAASGCTSTSGNSTTQQAAYQKDIVPYGDFSGQWNDESQTNWFVNGNLQSLKGTEYSKVDIELTAYDAQGKVVGQKNITAYKMYFDTVMKVTSEPDHVNMTVLNATPA